MGFRQIGGFRGAGDFWLSLANRRPEIDTGVTQMKSCLLVGLAEISASTPDSWSSLSTATRRAEPRNTTLQ